MIQLLEAAFDYILDNEGGWSNHSKDKGGKTNLGITLKTFRQAAAEMDGHNFDLDGDGDVDADDLRKMEKPLALSIFDKYYWLVGFNRLAPRIAIKTADYGFNMGPAGGVKRLQTAINAIAAVRNTPGLIVDGKLGPKTIQLANLANETELLNALQQEGLRFYRAIVEKDPEQAAFIHGWSNRAMRLP